MTRSTTLSSLFIAGVLALFGAPVARADSSTSTNWSGYVAHRGGVNFRRVTALWTQPSTTCTAGDPTYSAVWVGLGGYSLTSKALEQIGTEADCRTSGKAVSSAWYELVPAPSRGIRMTVNPGDVMAGRVVVVGDRVTLTLTDRTRHKSFSKTVNDSSLDVTSADWIVEAPSECNDNSSQCQTLPLADFGSETFARAMAETTSGRVGSISSKLWGTSAIKLAPAGRRFLGYGSDNGGESAPSSLTDCGASFKVTYAAIAPASGGTPAEEAKISSSPSSSSSASASSVAGLQPGGARR